MGKEKPDVLRGRGGSGGGLISCGTSLPGLANIPSAFFFTDQTILFTTSKICFLKKSHLEDPWVFPGERRKPSPEELSTPHSLYGTCWLEGKRDTDP